MHLPESVFGRARALGRGGAKGEGLGNPKLRIRQQAGMICATCAQTEPKELQRPRGDLLFKAPRGGEGRCLVFPCCGWQTVIASAVRSAGFWLQRWRKSICATNILESPQGCQYPRGVLLYLLCAAHKLRQVSVNALREAALVSPTSSSMELRSPAIQHRCRGLVAHVCQAELGRRSATRNAN